MQDTFKSRMKLIELLLTFIDFATSSLNTDFVVHIR